MCKHLNFLKFNLLIFEGFLLIHNFCALLSCRSDYQWRTFWIAKEFISLIIFLLASYFKELFYCTICWIFFMKFSIKISIGGLWNCKIWLRLSNGFSYAKYVFFDSFIIRKDYYLCKRLKMFSLFSLLIVERF